MNDKFVTQIEMIVYKIHHPNIDMEIHSPKSEHLKIFRLCYVRFSSVCFSLFFLL